jgi:hypothetical protein
MPNNGILHGARLSFDLSVPQHMRRAIARDEIYCQMCGASSGETDELSGRLARFNAESVPNNGLGFRRQFPDVRILCTTCKQGAKHVATERPSEIWLLSQIRRAGIKEQKAIYSWLEKKFKD